MKGIYQIRNINNGLIYIGSSQNIELRWQRHKSALKNKQHHSYKLQKAWNINPDHFTFEILEVVDGEMPRDKLYILEQQYLDQYQPYIHGYNVSSLAESPEKYNPLKKKVAKYAKDIILLKTNYDNIIKEINIPDDVELKLTYKEKEKMSVPVYKKKKQLYTILPLYLECALKYIYPQYKQKMKSKMIVEGRIVNYKTPDTFMLFDVRITLNNNYRVYQGIEMYAINYFKDKFKTQDIEDILKYFMTRNGNNEETFEDYNSVKIFDPIK